MNLIMFIGLYLLMGMVLFIATITVTAVYAANAVEFDELKKYVCDQQRQINELRRIIEKGR